MGELLDEKYKINLMPFQWEAFNGDFYLAEEFLRLRDKYNLTTAVELGTCLGSTSLWMAENFEHVKTIEINQQYFDIAQERLLGTDVEMYLGDTVAVLPDLIPFIPKESVVFADSHWTNNNPLIEELHLLKHVKPKVIVIHDFKVPDHPEFGYDEYPDQNIVYDFDYIKDHIEGYSHYYNDVAEGAKRGVIFLIRND